MYTIVINGKPEGPYSLAKLKELNIKADTFVRKPGMDDYKEAHELLELRELMGFNFKKTAPQYFASFDQRLLASAIDYFLILVFIVIVLLVSYLIINDKLIRLTLAFVFSGCVPLIKLIYSSIAEASPKQATIGKKLLDIKVTDLLGNRITLSTSFARNISKIFSTLPLFFGYLYSFLNKQRQCFHDKITDTLVIKQRLL